MVAPAFAEEAAEAATYASYEEFMASVDAVMFTINNLWILMAAILVAGMHLGFAMLESGLCQAKNTTNILFKNTFIIFMGIITYALVGFNTMYPGDFNGFVSIGGMIGFGDDAVGNLTAAYDEGFTYWSDFIFQAMFAATAATIVSGAVAERIKLPSFMVFVALLVAFFYPIAGSWQWGGGWLEGMGFHDFAGSSIVHGFGGFAALACVMILGARRGKFGPNGKSNAIPGHSMPLATLGVFILFIGWFGFNGGSVLSADPAEVSYVFVNTALAASFGCMGAILVSWSILKKPDLSMALNGVLAGLVAITAGADVIALPLGMLSGFLGGVIVVFGILGLDRCGIDDPVGAISVHGIVGIWGTLAVGIFSAAHSVLLQLIGTLSYAIFAFFSAYILFTIVKLTMGVRVSEEHEYEGLDIAEHAQEAYNIPTFGGGTGFGGFSGTPAARTMESPSASPSLNPATES
ncbi:MAG: ammonium transporter [Candidatus Sumerlaeia bacterium]|nr:ammonium transporter [Candidatus Sumerlaeia bacterium]